MTDHLSPAPLWAEKGSSSALTFALKLQRMLLVLLTMLFCVTALAEVAVPNLTQHVTDLTGTLTVGEQQALETKLSAFEQTKGSQIAV